jgi:phospholipase C
MFDHSFTRRLTLVCLPLALAACGGGGDSASSVPASPAPPLGGPPNTPPPGTDAIQHIVFIIKENRSFDNYFGTFPGADGATTGTTSTGQVILLGHTPDRTPRDICHEWGCAIEAIDGGKMDRFNLIQGCNVNGDFL